MQHIIATILIGIALAGPAAAQVPNVQQLLQGLTTGNQGQDQALRDAFERGYQRGRQDEAQPLGCFNRSVSQPGNAVAGRSNQLR